MLGSRIFVAVVFALLALAFSAATYTLFTEFGSDDWFSLAVVYSPGFLFFPTVGLVALVSFYTPASIFVDFYWHHVKHGKVRFLIGTVLVCALSVYIADELSKSSMFSQLFQQKETQKLQGDYIPAIWELHPDTLKSDPGTPEGCAFDDQLCARQPVYRSVQILRKVSQSRTGLTAFARNCSSDPLLEDPPETKLKRYCFPILRKVDAASCCFAQSRFSNELAALFAGEKLHSQTRFMHNVTLPFKVFFMLIILIIGMLLAAWRSQLDRFYPAYINHMENGVLIGATSMLFWPASNQAFLQSAATLYGPYSGSDYQEWLGPVFSGIFGLWALLILFFFFRHQEKNMELWVKVVGGIASLIAAIRYEEIMDLAVRFVGTGSYEYTYPVLALLGLLLYLSSFFLPERKSRSDLGVKPTIMATPPAPGTPITGASLSPSSPDTNPHRQI